MGGAFLFEKIDEDYFLTVDLYDETAIGPLRFGAWVPLRFRVKDNDPHSGSVMRKEDWDEVSDYARLLRFVEVSPTIRGVDSTASATRSIATVRCSCASRG